jgi:hypothetical protein
VNRKLVAISIVVLLITSLSLTVIPSATAASSSGGWITSYTIADADTGKTLVEYDAATDTNQTLAAVIPGESITITFTVNIVAGGDGNLKLASGLSKPASGVYWEISSDSDYDLGSDFTPNSANAQFNWVEGEFTMTLYGTVPSSTSTTAKTVNALTLSGPSGTVLQRITIKPTSAGMSDFLTLLNEKEDTLQSLKDSGVDQGFIEIYENVLTNAQAVADAGDSENAMALLEGLDTSTTPASSAMQMLFIPIVAVTAVLAVIFLVMFMRVRGKISYFQLVVEDQIKDLEGLTMRAAKIDRAMSSNLESVKERLKRLVGL